MGVLCTLREPSREEASQWHKPRKNTPAVRMQALTEFLLTDTAVQLVKRAEGATELLFDSGQGPSLRITIRLESIEARVGPFLVKGTDPQADHEAYNEAISGLIEVLQVSSGFYVYSDELIGFEPCGSCPGCGLEVFEWQGACEICEAKLHVPRPGEDEHDGHGQRVVDVLLRRNMIELASPRGRRNVEKTVSVFYAYDGGDPGILLGLLMELADVAEIYCDERELGRVLQRIK